MATIIQKPQENQKVATLVTGAQDNARPIRIMYKLGVLVVIPCYNEEVSIGSMVLRSLPYAGKVVVIDDGSTDKTAEIARLAGAEVVSHGVNKGKGAGIRSAFEYAKRENMGVLVLIDGDGQHNPDEIPYLIEPILKGEADMVNGSRFLAKNSHKVPAYRRIGQEILTLATNAGSGQKITDSQNGFRAFSRKTYDSFSFGENGMGIESEMLMDAANAHLRIKEVQIDVRYDVAGSTYNPVVHGFNVLGSVLKTIVRKKQTLVYGLPGSILLLIGMIALLYPLLGTGNISGGLAISIATVSILCVTLGALCIFTILIIKSIHGIKIKS